MKAFKIIALGIFGLVISTSSYGQTETKPALKTEKIEFKEKKMVKREGFQQKKPMQKADPAKKATPAKIDPVQILEKKSPSSIKQPVKKAELIENKKD